MGISRSMPLPGVCSLRTRGCETEAPWSFLPLHVEQLVLATAWGMSLDWMVWLDMANPSFPPSPWLSLYIKTTLIHPCGLGFSRLFPHLPNLFISHFLSFLTCTFFIQCNFLTLPYSLALGLFLSSHKTHSFFIIAQENATEFIDIRQPLGTGWEEEGWQQNKVEPNPWQESGNCIHPWEPGEETDPWSRFLLWQQVLQFRCQAEWLTESVPPHTSDTLMFLVQKLWKQGLQNVSCGFRFLHYCLSPPCPPPPVPEQAGGVAVAFFSFEGSRVGWVKIWQRKATTW